MSKNLFQIYLDEVKQIPACTPEEEDTLPGLAKQGDAGARKRLLEGMLHYALELASDFRNRGIPVADLVQEANMGLILALDAYQEGDFREQVKESVDATIRAAIEEQKLERQVEEEVIARVNVLKDISRQMAEDLGREATVEELAEKMKMTVDEIKDIMKLTLDALSVDPVE